MKSRRSPHFKALLNELPLEVRQQAFAAYQQFRRDPFHPELFFKRVGKHSSIWSARIGRGYRALGLREV